MKLDRPVKVLSNDEMALLHEKTLYLLENKGVAFDSETALETFKKAGAKVDGRVVYIPANLVEKSLEQTPQTFKVTAMDPAKAITVGEGFICHPDGGEPFLVDHKGNRVLEPTMKDFADLQKLYQAMPNIGMAGYEPITPCDVPDRVKNLHLAMMSFRCSDKPMVTPMEMYTNEQREEVLKLFEIAYGSDQGDSYMTWQISTPNSPFLYTETAAQNIEFFAAKNQPVCIVGAPLSGLTGPVQNFANVITDNVDQLAGLTLAQLVQPGVPVLLSATLVYGNMRYGTWECSSPDTWIQAAAMIQMLKDYYKLPARCQGGITSSKCIDWQAGMEAALGLEFLALAGANIVSNATGSLSNLMSTSKEKVILDNEEIGRILRILEGINTDEDHVNMEDLMNVEHGGEFLRTKNTRKYHREGYQPSISDWTTSDMWEKAGSRDIRDVAHDEMVKILKDAPDSILDSAVEKEMEDYIKSVEKKVL